MSILIYSIAFYFEEKFDSAGSTFIYFAGFEIIISPVAVFKKLGECNLRILFRIHINTHWWYSSIYDSFYCFNKKNIEFEWHKTNWNKWNISHICLPCFENYKKNIIDFQGIHSKPYDSINLLFVTRTQYPHLSTIFIWLYLSSNHPVCEISAYELYILNIVYPIRKIMGKVRIPRGSFSHNNSLIFLQMPLLSTTEKLICSSDYFWICWQLIWRISERLAQILLYANTRFYHQKLFYCR